MRVAILKYNAGNTASVADAIARLGGEPLVTDSADEISTADRVIIPGVGEATSAMRFILTLNLDRIIKSLRQPVLGICLGMQILCKSSAEGNAECLGIFPYSVNRLHPRTNEKIPHIGWNKIYVRKSGILDGIGHDAFVYFAHSFAVDDYSEAAAFCDYSGGFAAALEQDNFFGVQFHPEKSAETGRRILENFMNL